MRVKKAPDNARRFLPSKESAAYQAPLPCVTVVSRLWLYLLPQSFTLQSIVGLLCKSCFLIMSLLVPYNNNSAVSIICLANCAMRIFFCIAMLRSML